MSIQISDLKASVDIDQVILAIGGAIQEPFGDRRNRWLQAWCPFHPDKRPGGTPSASVHIQKGRFRCHGCDVSGDIVDVAKTYLGTADTREAMAWLTTHFTRQ